MAVKSVIEAVREAMHEELVRDSKVLIMGEDIGQRGGVFLATQGFLDEFGPGRVIDTPLAEASIVGIALGASFRGLRPIAEVEFADFIWPHCQPVNRRGFPCLLRHQWCHLGPDGGACALWRRHTRRSVPLSECGVLLLSYARSEGRCPGYSFRCQGSAQVGHPRRQPGSLLGAQEDLPSWSAARYPTGSTAYP